MSETVDTGFWRLQHDELRALLARTDLTWETARVYLALADLTLGWGKTRDVVSLSQIANHAGMFYEAEDGSQCADRAHVCRALRALAAAGLCGSAPSKGQMVVRWVTWPVPQAGSGTVATYGNSAGAETAAVRGSSSVAEGVAKTGAKGAATAGNHQDVQEDQDTEKERDRQRPRPASLSEGAHTETAKATANGNDVDRLLAFAFPSGKPPEKALAACMDRIAEAMRLGATYPLLAHAVISPKAKGSTPWERITAAGERVRELIDRAKAEIAFPGDTLAALLEYVPVNGRPSNETAECFQKELRGWRRQATKWPLTEAEGAAKATPQKGASMKRRV
jgi:hypothetical protein